MDASTEPEAQRPPADGPDEGGRETGDGDEGEFVHIVAALRSELREKSLRGLAREVGMSPTGLRGVLDGTVPYGRTRERLRQWWWRGKDELSPPGAEAALRRLLAAVTDTPAGMARVLDAVEEAHRGAGAPVPPWVDIIRERLAHGAVR
jgi:hypothetical protein